MGAQKQTFQKQTSCIWSRRLYFISKICVAVSLCSVLSAYILRNIGYVHHSVKNTSAEQPAKDAASSGFWSTFWGLFVLNNKKPESKLERDYPHFCTFVQTVDYGAENIFSTIDYIALWIYRSVVQISNKFCGGLSCVYGSFHVQSFLHNVELGISSICYGKSGLIVVFIIGLLVCLYFLTVFIYHMYKRKANIERDHRSVPQTSQLYPNSTRFSDNKILHTVPKKRIPVKRTLFALVGLCFVLSLPWEFVRIYQAEVAKKAAVTLKGTPPECIPYSATLWQSIKAWLTWQLSWDDDPCEKYHHALLVDPVWEVTPMLVLSSVICRCITVPCQILFSTVGSSLRLMLREVPAHWQPVVMATVVIILILCLLTFCSYRISMPLFLKIEPFKKTPVIIRSCKKRNCIVQPPTRHVGRDVVKYTSQYDEGGDWPDPDSEKIHNWSQISEVSEFDF